MSTPMLSLTVIGALVSAGLLVWLTQIVREQLRYREHLSWIAEQSKRGCERVMSKERGEISDGLQLLAAFRVSDLPSDVLARVAVLAGGDDRELAALARRVLVSGGEYSSCRAA